MPMTDKREKKVEFCPSLSPIDSQHRPQSPANSAITWDTETDHMLSYFLGGDGALHSHPGVPDFSSPAGSPRRSHPPVSQDEKREESNSDDEDNAAPPPTPTVQHFYAGLKKKASPQKPAERHATSSSEKPAPVAMASSSNTASSLPSIAESLVSGGPMVQHKMQRHQLPSKGSLPAVDSFSPDNPSPLSPAALIGIPQENLLLPPPGGSTASVQFQQAAAAASSQHHHQQHNHHPQQQQQQDQQQQQQHPSQHPARHQQHMAWLSDLNARAKMASSSTSGPHHQPVVFLPHPAAAGVPSQVGMPPVAIMSYYPHMAVPQSSNPYLFAAAMAHQQQQQQQQHREPVNPVESEEKRVKRLERNRESARKSRRKKKERLATLEAQVNQLYQRIDTERRVHIGTMVESLKNLRKEEVPKHASDNDKSSLHQLIQHTGPFSTVSRSVLNFQYTRLRQLTLPGYQKFVLWSVLRESSFFTTAKEEFARREAEANNGQQPRASTSKVSSKQIGEELFDEGTSVESQSPDAKERAAGKYASSYANDISRTWPLFCSELKLSVDQEEKFLLFRRKMRQIPDLQNVQSQMNAAVQTAESLRTAVHSLSQAVAQREERATISILSPAQTAAYQQWLSSNREVCRKAVSSQRHSAEPNTESGAKDASLHDICRRLNEVLRISKAP